MSTAHSRDDPSKFEEPTGTANILTTNIYLIIYKDNKENDRENERFVKSKTKKMFSIIFQDQGKNWYVTILQRWNIIVQWNKIKCYIKYK